MLIKQKASKIPGHNTYMMILNTNFKIKRKDHLSRCGAKYWPHKRLMSLETIERKEWLIPSHDKILLK